VIESTDELGNDLAGVMTLQRRLSGMERDLAAIQAKVTLYFYGKVLGTKKDPHIYCKFWRI
jgi:hypothetical protein